MTAATGDSLNYTYDALHRLQKVTTKNANGAALFSTAYAFKANGTKTTPLVEYRNVRIGTSGTILEGKKYEYDAVGNITAICESTGLYRKLVAYTYDEQNQLLSETYYTYSGTSTTPATTDVYSYTYDTAGNILTEAKNGTVTKGYTYSDGDWKDLLTEFNGEEINYDGAGNPLAYANSTSWYYFRWDHGRNLRFATVDNAESYYVGFDYDLDGIRTKKSVTVDSTGITTSHNYITQNGKVVRETIGSGTSAKVLDFIYDESGKPFALIYTNGAATPETYYYVLNLQGDVVGLIDSTCAWVAQYTYNAWGEIITSSGTMAEINPLRYRGYYYDTETGFYYLQSRYYDPITHRFINADSYATTDSSDAISCNMFAYCGNNPVNNADPEGTFFKKLLKWAVNEVLEPATDSIKSYLADKNGTFSIGPATGGTFGIWSFNVQGCISFDLKGNIALQGSFYGGLTTSNAGATGIISLTATDAPDIEKLNGDFYQVGGSGSFNAGYVPLTAGGDFLFFEDPETNKMHSGLSIGGGFGFEQSGGAPWEAHILWGRTGTWEATKFNVFDELYNFYNLVKKW